MHKDRRALRKRSTWRVSPETRVLLDALANHYKTCIFEASIGDARLVDGKLLGIDVEFRGEVVMVRALDG